LLLRVIFFFPLFLIFSVITRGQHSGYTFLSWENISLLEGPAVPSDTNIILITNRKFDPHSKDKAYFGNEIDPEGKLRYLVASCNNNKWTISLKETLEEAISLTKVSRDYLFFIHGDGQTLPDVLDRCIRIERLYAINVIAFDWPSKIPDFSRMRNFYNSKRNAKRSVTALEESLIEFGNYISQNGKNHDIIHSTLFVHSLGNFIIKKFVDNSTAISAKTKFDNILLNAPAVKQKKHRKWVEKLNFQKKIYITSNKKDRTLYGAHLITFRRQLGERLRKPLAKNAIYINFLNLVGKRHNYYLDLPLLERYPSISFFYKSIFHGEYLDPEYKARFKKRKDGLGYDIL
jgi:hypothetical protein